MKLKKDKKFFKYGFTLALVVLAISYYFFQLDKILFLAGVIIVIIVAVLVRFTLFRKE